jgi:intein/homing endonuclease
MILVSGQDIINTYSIEKQFSCKKYYEYLKLVKLNPSFGYKRCAKLLGVPQGRTRWWHTKGEKNAVPIPLKTVKKLKENNLLPFTEKHKNAEDIFRMLGVLFGDGGIDARLNTMAFISSDKKDIDLWQQDLLRIFPFTENKISIVEGGEYGHSFNIRTFDRSIIRFFAALQAVVGDKVKTDYSLPNYIFNLSKRNRIAFLDGLLASEVSVPSFRNDSLGNKRFTNLSLSLSKIDFLESSHRNFMRTLEDLLESVGIEVTGNLRKDFHLQRERKDGNLSSPYRIFVRTIFGKVLQFDKTFSLKYAVAKKQRLQKEIEIAIEYKKQLQKTIPI